MRDHNGSPGSLRHGCTVPPPSRREARADDIRPYDAAVGWIEFVGAGIPDRPKTIYLQTKILCYTVLATQCNSKYVVVIKNEVTL